MYRLLYFMNSLSTWVGKGFAWCILVLTLGTTYEVFVRYGLREPTGWAFDMSYIMYGALFMMGGAYTLSRDAHVRGDVLFRLWSPRAQAWIELVLYFIFFFPGMLAMVYAGLDYAMESWSYMPYGPEGRRGEVSIFSPIGVPVSPLKTILPVAAFFLMLQGIAEVVRCVICIRTGQWPQRMHDVEELETVLLREREQALEHELHLDELPTLSVEDEQRKGEER
ncbi:MAG: TRAP transporter small permease subunit [Gammaproteobacteria bacterium]|nr:TRAP transporter small permease subunit [Gammaproteobacteria bacterium]NIR84965.1 TRAP transporter small permease subunit [Gammaproteobacteria bacterium]NIR91814.1 TRAP transporter small permease subunit [Gammaproteobacteria bacterium]NIU06012.1 TRAP transporter small permease subunit [Gammaproteobacteria bacterium]NIV53059.1 TRAP transporter small permease subunit [Gammaproteobacteria bacterium]